MAQLLKGKVVSNKTAKTVVVEVDRLKEHPVYGKRIKISKRYKAHSADPIEEGKTVIIKSMRPISKDKKWAVDKIL